MTPFPLISSALMHLVCTMMAFNHAFQLRVSKSAIDHPVKGRRSHCLPNIRTRTEVSFSHYKVYDEMQSFR